MKCKFCGGKLIIRSDPNTAKDAQWVRCISEKKWWDLKRYAEMSNNGRKRR